MFEHAPTIAASIIGIATGAVLSRHAVSERMPRLSGDGEPERVDFPCAQVCQRCRYLGDASAPCPVCQSELWFDTQLVEMTEFLRNSEAYEQDEPPTWVNATTWGMVLAVMALGAGILWFAGFFHDFEQDNLEYGTILVAMGAMLAYGTYAFRPIVANWLFALAGGRGQVDRWHHPLNPAVAGATKGVPEVLEPLHAPLSGQPCAAWLLVADLRAPGSRSRQRVLIEHRSAPMELNGEHYAADRFAVDGRPKRVRGMEASAERRVLRERGLLLSDGEYVLREAIVPLGVSVTSHNFDKQHFSALKAGRAAKDGPGGPYRG